MSSASSRRTSIEQRRLVDFPALVTRAGLAADFVLQERRVAPLSRWDGHRLHPHATFLHLTNTRTLRARGAFRVLRAHEDVLAVRVARLAPAVALAST
ncbi:MULTISPECIES: hypothetical protein [Glycomyces]|uniref:Uncharacterized protein n=2 Tax=Glycomyces TaxID=58113 RepID=A0A9X3PNY5_9ACTN|nr:hypothetical protein [Glycomyces lechevalierae]MDA1387153.1 hypothetical protein [Glycomyces lechevalierae]MDR7336705.1 hypothetical protein [Glycomyces lechevalierae]